MRWTVSRRIARPLPRTSLLRTPATLALVLCAVTMAVLFGSAGQAMAHRARSACAPSHSGVSHVRARARHVRAHSVGSGCRGAHVRKGKARRHAASQTTLGSSQISLCATSEEGAEASCGAETPAGCDAPGATFSSDGQSFTCVPGSPGSSGSAGRGEAPGRVQGTSSDEEEIEEVEAGD